MKKRVLISGVLLVLIAVGAVIGLPYYTLHFSTVELKGEEQTLYVPTGSSLADVGVLMENNGVLDKSTFNRFAASFELTDDKIEPGKYKVINGMKIKHLIYGLKNGNQEVKDVRITFNNCQNVYDMAGKVAPYIETDSVQLVSYIMAPQTLEKYGFRETTISSLFLPDTYEVGEWDMTAEEFVQRMADEYKNFWTAERKTKATALNLSQSDVATVASIIEAEQSINTVEWKTIAGLYLNRVKRGMLLQSDPTAKFCWGDELEGTQRLLTIHMQKDCPYNTYIYPGLPPVPFVCHQKKLWTPF